jgi:putative ABC transport system substrate-binding protein
MIGRRKFMRLVAGAALPWPLVARAQQSAKVRRIAFVHSGISVDKLTESSGTFWIRMFFQELRALGLVEGVNLVVNRFSAEGSNSHFASVAADIVSRKPEVIISNSNPLVRVIMTATTTIPIVGIMGDPVAGGLASNLAQPGGNLTGVSIDGGPGITAKRLQILKEAIPTTAKVAYLVGTRAEEQRSGIAQSARLLTEVNETQLRRTFTELAEEKTDAVVMSDNGSFLANVALIVELAAIHRLPAIYAYRQFVEAGGLLAYGPDLGELAKRMAVDVQQILGGAKPGDIPIYQPKKFEFVINLKTAKALGLAIPQAVLAQADEVIE